MSLATTVFEAYPGHGDLNIKPGEFENAGQLFDLVKQRGGLMFGDLLFAYVAAVTWTFDDSPTALASELTEGIAQLTAVREAIYEQHPHLRR